MEKTEFDTKDLFANLKLMKFSQKSKSHKIFWTIVIILFILFLAELGLRYYEKWQGVRQVEELARELERIESEREAIKTADTIGGKTPQETLRMFISAVEAGDYELASKYFVVEEQEKWKKELNEIKVKDNLETFLGPLVEARISQGEYSKSKDTHSIHKPVLISFVKYPSGNWKIEEI